MHTLILGQSGSGKTTLMKLICRMAKEKGKKVLILDPCLDPDYVHDFKTDDIEKFLDAYWQSTSCLCVIEEAGDTVGRFDDEMRKTATRGRHCGHLNYYVAQRATTINKTVRDQCSELYLFNSSFSDSKIHAQEWNRPELETAPQLLPGEYYHVRRFGGITKGNIFANNNMEKVNKNVV